MSKERMTSLATELFRLGVSHSGVQELLSLHELDEVERQLAYLPFRKAKRPEAFIIEAVRRKYSPPKDFYYANDPSQLSDSEESLDKDPELPTGSSDAEFEGHRTESPTGNPSPDNRL